MAARCNPDLKLTHIQNRHFPVIYPFVLSSVSDSGHRVSPSLPPVRGTSHRLDSLWNVPALSAYSLPPPCYRPLLSLAWNNARASPNWSLHSGVSTFQSYYSIGLPLNRQELLCPLSVGLKNLATLKWPHPTFLAYLSLLLVHFSQKSDLFSVTQYLFTSVFRFSLFNLGMPAHLNCWNPNSLSRTISYVTFSP